MPAARAGSLNPRQSRPHERHEIPGAVVMRSPVQTELIGSADYPYVKLTWEATYWPGIYSNYPPHCFPTEKAAYRFAEGSISSTQHVIRAEVYSKENVLLDMFGAPYESV